MSYEEKDSGYMIGHFPCIADEVDGKDSCGSSDALAIYEHEDAEGVWYDGYCYSCCQSFSKTQVHGSSVGGELGVEGGVVTERKPFERKPKAQPLEMKEVVAFIKEVGYDSGDYRGIKDEYSRFFGHLTKVSKQGKVLARYYPETKDGKVTGYKCRNTPKDFTRGKLGLTGMSCELSGQVKFKDYKGHRDILVVGGECYSDDTELLTEKGWMLFKDLPKDLMVYQVDSKGGASLVEPTDYICKKPVEDYMVHYNNRMTDILVTANHKMCGVHRTSGEDYYFRAEDGPDSQHDKYRKHTIYNGRGVNLSDDQLSFIIAMSADSKVDIRKTKRDVAHFNFIKERKIERLRGLLDRLGMEYTHYGKEGRNWACGRKFATFNVGLEDWCPSKGLPLTWLKDLSLSQKKHVISEITLWDGNHIKGRSGMEFSSKLKEEAELVHGLAITCGYHAHLRKRSNSLGEWYVVRVAYSYNKASYQKVVPTKVPYQGLVYCVTVPEGRLLTRRNGKVAVCGNCDKAAAFQILRENQKRRGQEDYAPVAVVSPTTGEGSAYKQMQKQYDFLNQFENIIIGMDNDEAGWEATRKIIEVLPKEKVKIASWTGKDPNKMLQDGNEKQFLSDFFNAKPVVHNGIMTSTEMMGAVEEELLRPRISLPDYMQGVTTATKGGLLQGRIINIIGDTSCGKSTHVNGMVYHWLFNTDVKCGVVSLEATAGQYGLDMLSLHLEQNLAWYGTGQETLDYLKNSETKKLTEDLWINDYGEPRWALLDERDGDIKHLERQMECLVKKHGCGILVIDVLSDILRGLPNEQQSDHMNFQKNMIKSGVTIINVLHTRKPPPNRGGIPQKCTDYDALGSSTFVQSAAINIVINRNKMAKCPIEKNTTYVDLPKCRSGETGAAGEWYFDPDTRQVYDRNQYFADNPEKLPAGFNLEISSFDKEYYDDDNKKGSSGGAFQAEPDFMKDQIF